MKTRILAMLAALLLCGAEARPATPAESFTVNGLKVILVPNKANDIIAANMYFRGGSSALETSQAGIEELALQVAVMATKNFPKDKLSEEIESMDTRIAPSAGRDYASISLQCVRQNLGRSWKVFTDVILNPSFDSADVALEKTQAIAAIRQSKDDPDRYLMKLTLDAFFIDHPYATDPSGTERTMQSFTGNELKEFMRGKVVTSGMLLVVVGNADRAELEAMVKESFGAIPRGDFSPSIPPEVRFQTPSIKIVQRELPTNYITGCFPAPRFGSEDSSPMSLAVSILRHRLFKEVRTKRSLSYAPAAGLGQLSTNWGRIYVTAVKPETTMTVMIDEVKKLQDEPVSTEVLNGQRNTFLTGSYLNTETNASQAELLARYEISGIGYAEGEKFMQNIRKVTPADIQKVCQKYMHNLQFVLLGNPAGLQLGPFMY